VRFLLVFQIFFSSQQSFASTQLWSWLFGKEKEAEKTELFVSGEGLFSSELHQNIFNTFRTHSCVSTVQTKSYPLKAIESGNLEMLVRKDLGRANINLQFLSSNDHSKFYTAETENGTLLLITTSSQNDELVGWTDAYFSDKNPYKYHSTLVRGIYFGEGTVNGFRFKIMRRSSKHYLSINSQGKILKDDCILEGESSFDLEKGNYQGKIGDWVWEKEEFADKCGTECIQKRQKHIDLPPYHFLPKKISEQVPSIALYERHSFDCAAVDDYWLRGDDGEVISTNAYGIGKGCNWDRAYDDNPRHHRQHGIKILQRAIDDGSDIQPNLVPVNFEFPNIRYSFNSPKRIRQRNSDIAS